MNDDNSKRTRREFIKRVGVTAGATALGSSSPAMGTTFTLTPLVFPELNQRARGWLRFLWSKATTNDDWSSKGVPHPWWDRYTAPGVLSYPRFDLHESTYALVMMADQTPAWREVYTRIVDELASRYPTYWGAIDWLTQIGDDPNRENYPPKVMNSLPERLRGKYNRIGWTANGVEPWGLQKDPIGADGNLFFRGWFNLVLSIYKYVSGDDKWEKPFAVTGYKDQQFEWTQHRIVEHLEKQWTKHPEGIHCENTKIWPICLSSAGLGMYLYDRIFAKRSHLVYENWLNEKFGWWFKLREKYPRGQRSALMMVSEIGDGGDWIGAFQASHTDKFNAPTVEGVDFPSLGVYQAWNDIKSGTLYVGTYPASPDRQGLKTSWRVTGIPDTNDVVVLCDGQPFKQYEVEGPGTIRIDTTIDTRRYHIYTGYRGKAVSRDDMCRQQNEDKSAAVPPAQCGTESSHVTSETVSDFGPSCPCCL